MNTLFNKAVKSTATLLLAGLLFGATSATAASKIGYVDMQSIAKQIPQMAAIDQQLQTEFAERAEGIKKLESDIKFEAEKLKREGPTMSKKQKEDQQKKIVDLRKNYEAQVRPFQQELNTRRSEELNKVQGLIKKAIDNEAKAGKYDLILFRDQMAFFNEKSVKDLSKKVADRISKEK